MPLTQAQCVDVIRRLGFAFTEGEGTITVTPPSWRFDLTIEEDLIEEVIRIHGYDKLPGTAPLAPVTARVRPESRRSMHALRGMLAALDYQETIAYSFVEERCERELAGNANPIRLLNPIDTTLPVMRSSLIGSLVATLRHNLAHRASRVRIFEAGRVYRRNAAAADGEVSVAGIEQPMHLSALAYGPVDGLQWGVPERAVEFFDAKGDVQALLCPLQPQFVAAAHPALHPGRSARVHVDGHAVGWIGELHPRWCQGYELPQAPVVFELDLEALLERPLPRAQPLPRQQSVLRDLALVVSEGVSHDALIAALNDDASGLVRSARLFDMYRPKDAQGHERSMTVRLELRDDHATLTDERIEAAMEQARERALSRLGARLRS
jgi:phenylalanyl-tRNA synthetase beta chain